MKNKVSLWKTFDSGVDERGIQKEKMSLSLKLLVFFSLALMSWLWLFFHFETCSLPVRLLLLTVMFAASMFMGYTTFLAVEIIRDLRRDFFLKTEEGYGLRLEWERYVFRWQLILRVVVAVLLIVAYFLIVRKVAAYHGGNFIMAVIMIYSLEPIFNAKRFANRVQKLKTMTPRNSDFNDLEEFLLKVSILFFR